MKTSWLSRVSVEKPNAESHFVRDCFAHLKPIRKDARAICGKLKCNDLRRPASKRRKGGTLNTCDRTDAEDRPGGATEEWDH